MLTHFRIDNFKALVDFSLPDTDDRPLGNLVCLVGLNGSGKSTFLQAMDFVSQLAVGDISRWLEMRGWDKSDLVQKGSKKRSISFSVTFESKGIGGLVWSGSYNYLMGRCTSEKLTYTPADKKIDFLPTEVTVLHSENGIIRDSFGERRELTSEFEGSAFNQLKIGALGFTGLSGNIVLVLRTFMQGVKSLELLSPHSMRRSSKAANDVGYGGESLAAFINGLSTAEKKSLFDEMTKFYPHLSGIVTKNLQYGWKRLKITESYQGAVELDARHVNDGFLRVAAIIAQTVARSGRHKLRTKSDESEEQLGNLEQKGYELILLDEVENGINPELVQRLITYLVSVRQQVFVTTHSPLILNYLPDDVAKESIFVLYRCHDGSSHAKRFFDIPSAARKLEVMGPGEAFLDIRLEELTRSLAAGGDH